jgi:hypothetical protein
MATTKIESVFDRLVCAPPEDVARAVDAGVTVSN